MCFRWVHVWLYGRKFLLLLRDAGNDLDGSNIVRIKKGKCLMEPLQIRPYKYRKWRLATSTKWLWNQLESTLTSVTFQTEGNHSNKHLWCFENSNSTLTLTVLPQFFWSFLHIFIHALLSSVFSPLHRLFLRLLLCTSLYTVRDNRSSLARSLSGLCVLVMKFFFSS